MVQKHFNRLLMLLVAFMTMCVTQVWGEEGDTHDFAQSLSQLLNNSASISSIEIPIQTYSVKEVKVTWSYNKDIANAVTIAVSVGGKSFGSASVTNGSSQETSFKTTPLSSIKGAISIAFTNNCESGTGKGTFSVSNVQLVEGESDGYTHDVLTNADFTATSTTYTDFSNVSKNTAVYAGNSAKNNGIQLRSNNSNSGIVSTTSGGKIKTVTVTWNSNTASGRTIDVYGSNTAYTSAADLYNNTKQGTKLGSIVMGTSTSFTVTGDYAYVGIRSYSGSLNIDDIDFAWEEGIDINTYTVSAESNNESWGTVSVDGMTITANPKSGYRVVADAGGYDVTAGTATVSHTGNSNTLTVTPSTDCTVQVNFEAIPMTTINWVVGGQAYSVGTPTTNIATGSLYSALTLPTAPADNTIGDCADHFMGWSTSNLGTTLGQSAPGDLFKTVAGNETVISSSEITFYAVFATGGGDVALDDAFAGREPSNNSYIDLNGVTKTINGVSYSFAKNTGGTTPQQTKQTTGGTIYPACIRLYAKNSMTISVVSGNITQIVLTQNDGSNALTANVGTYDADTKTWTGSASSVTFTVGGESGHNKYTNISVTTSVGGGGAASDYVTECVEPDKRIYLKTFAGWDGSSAKTALYDATNNTWIGLMNQGTGCYAGYLYLDVPSSCNTIVFGRFSSDEANSWPISGWNYGYEGNPGGFWNKSQNFDCTTNNLYTLDKSWTDNVANGAGSTLALPTYTLTFDANGHGTAPEAISDIECGSMVEAPADPEETGYTFVGWYKDSECTDANRWDFATNDVTTTRTLYAKWNVKSYTLIWNFDGGSTSATAGSEYTAGGSVEYGADINYPADNTMSREGYHFTGWSSTPATMSAGDLTLTAQWEVNSYDVKWYVNGVEYENGGSKSVNHGAAMSTLTLPTAPADNALSCKDKFMGWSETDLGKADGQDAPSDLFTSVAGKVTTITEAKNFYAVFADAEGGGGTSQNEITYNTENIPTSYGASADVVLNGMTFNVTQMYKNGEKMQWRANGNSNGTGALYNKTEIAGIQSIAITYTNDDSYKNFTVKVGDSENPTSGTEISAAQVGETSTYIYDCSTASSSYFVLTNGTNAGYLSSIVITYSSASYSNYVTKCCTTLSAPTNLQSVGLSEGITLSWTAAANATGYQIEWNGDTDPANYIDVNATTYTVNDLLCGGGTNYTWRIRAIYSGAGDYCSESDWVAGPSRTTAYCSCDDTYSFHYGTKNQSDWNEDNPVCFEATEISDGNSGVYYFSRNFTMPNKSHYYVGWAGGWNTTPWKSSTDELSGMPFFHMHGSKTLGAINAGSNAGAIGTLCIRSSYNDNNKYIDFIPGGYVLKIGENYDSYAFNPADADNVLETVWTTDLMTLNEDMLGHKIQVLLKTATGSVWSPNMSSDADVNGHIGQKSGAGDSWGANLSAADAGKTGKFRIWADNSAANWNVHFVPFVQATFDANGGSCGSAVMPAERVSVEAEASARTITLPEATKIGHSLLWSDGANTYAAGTEVELTADMAFVAQWTAESYGITYHLNDGEWDGEAGAANYIYGTGVGALADNVERENYRFEGWYAALDFSGGVVTTIAADALGAKEFWAKWTRVYAVQFEENRTVDDAKTVLLAVGENTTLPSTTISDCNEYDTFEGWVAGEVAETTTKPGSVLAGGASYTLEAEDDVTLKALYSKCEGDEPEVYEKVTKMSEVTNGTYIIATDKTYKNNSSTESGKAYLAKAGGNTYSTICTPTFDTEDANVITNSAEAMEFTITLGTGDDAGKFAISDGTYYLSAPSSNDITYRAIASGAVFDWEIMDGSTIVNEKTPVAGAIHSIGQSTRFLQMNHNNGTPRFACYTATQKDAFLYKKTGGCVKYYATNPNCYTVTYHHGDGTTSVEYVTRGENPTMTDIVARACAADRVFVGWSETEITTAVQTAPVTVDPTDATIIKPTDFYAVYASKNGGKLGAETSRRINTILSNAKEVEQNFIISGENRYSGVNAVNNWLALNFKDENNSIKTKAAVKDLSAVEFNWQAYGGNAENVVVSVSTNGENWQNVTIISSVSSSSMKTNKVEMPEVGDYYVKVSIPARSNTNDELCFNYITYYTKERSYYLTDYSTSCEKAASMTLTYDAQGGTAQTAVTEAGWVTLPTAVECERGCYTLTGWLCSGDGLTYAPGARYLFNHDVTMTAQWAVDAEAPVTVTYHTGLEGAETQMVADVHCGDKLDEKLPVPAPCDAYKFTFEGWTTNGSYAESTTAPEMIDLGTYVVNGDVALYAVWSHGKNIFAKQTAESPFDVGDQIIIVEPTHQQALSASLACAEAPETSTDIIETDEHYIVWTLSDAGDGKFNLKGINGNLHIGGNTTRSLELLDDANYASADYKGFTITRSSSNSNIYAITQDVADGKTRRVNFNKKKGIWNTYASNTAGYIYKKTDAAKTYTLDGVCERVYHATEAPVLITSTGQSLSAEGIVVVENPDANTPVAVLTDGSDHFTVTVSSEGVTTNGDGSKNYTYKVTYTPADANQTETATFSFQHSVVGGEAHTTPGEVTFTGHSLPTQFVIAAKVDDKYYMLPGNSAMGTPTAIEIEVVDGKAMNVEPEHIYSAQTVTKNDYKDIALSLNTTSGLLWQSQGGGTETNIANNGSASGSRYGLNYFSWTFDSEDYVTYTINNQTDDERNLAMNTSTKKFGYYNVNASYTDALYILPLGNIIITGDNTDFAGFDVADLSNMDVIIRPNATLTVNNAVTVKNLIFQMNEQDEVGAVKIDGTLNAEHVYLDMHITSANWHAISLPSAVNTADVMVDGAAGTFRSSTGWYMRAFASDEYAVIGAATNTKGGKNGWYNVMNTTNSALATTIPANTGVLVGAGHNDSEIHTLRFPIELPTQTTNKSVSLTYYTGTYAPTHHGWNFVGSPYASRYKTTAFGSLTKVTYPEAGGTGHFQQDLLTDMELKPFSAYFFQVAADMSQTYEPANRLPAAVAAPARAGSADEEEMAMVGLILTNAQGEADQTGLELSDEFTTGYEIGHDLVKMFGSSYTGYTQPVVYTTAPRGKMAFNALPYSATDMIPVGYYAAAQGTYTFSLNENRDMSALEAVYLTDTQTGAVTNLLYSSYEFTSARQATDDSRFYLTVVRAPKVPTDIDPLGGEGGSSGTEVIKIIRDNKLFIIRDGHVYDATGKQVK